jgi:uncharacterized membrane protein YkvA (DUF1232 family)
MATTMNQGTLPNSSDADGTGPRRLHPLATARRWMGRPIAGAVEAIGQRYLSRLMGVQGTLSEAVGGIPERMHLAANQTRLVLELLEDVRTGTYRELPWSSVALASAAVLYSLSPRDVIPDIIPVLGALDDITVISLAMRLLQRDLKAYCRYKGYREEEYFDTAARSRVGAIADRARHAS